MTISENMTVEELDAAIRELSEEKAYAQELRDAKLIRRGVTPEGTLVKPPEVYRLYVRENLTTDGGAIYIAGDFIEPSPMESLVLLREFPDVFEDTGYEYPK